MPPIVNIAAYQFAELPPLEALRSELGRLCRQWRLKGTILLSQEGINLFVAGQRPAVDALIDRLRQIPTLASLQVKESFSDDQPFNRMLVKIKREIIPFGVAAIDPRRYTSRRVTARQLRQWLDEGRSLTLLDTRNDFEVRAGTFRQAVPIGIEDFRDFPAAVAKLPDEMKRQPVVTFCTGGIRCEKGAPYLESAGFEEVYQLDGGILKYLEECGPAHFQGQCFVFDKRVALDGQLRPGGLQQCYACQAILSADEQSSPDYVPGESCPHCFEPAGVRHARQLETRQQAIREAASPPPGSIAYENVRPVSVPLRFDGLEVLDFLEAMRTHMSRGQWRDACETGRLICRGEPVRPGRIVRAGERLLHRMPAAAEPEVNTAIRLMDEDDQIVVVHKPAPLPTHPCGRFNRNSLSYILGKAFHPWRLRPAHRLDADTSGLIVFSKTAQVARHLQPQFDQGRVRKFYLARVSTPPELPQFECHEPLAAEPGHGGFRLPSADGLAASTSFRLLQTLSDGTALLEAQPLTGRTNQIRAHLWLIGCPIVGDPVYLPDQKLGNARTLSIADPPLCLHAAAIEFVHPGTGETVRYESPLPTWDHEGVTQGIWAS